MGAITAKAGENGGVKEGALWFQWILILAIVVMVAYTVWCVSQNSKSLDRIEAIVTPVPAPARI